MLLLLKLSIYLYTYIHIYTLSWVSAVSRGLGVSLISPFEAWFAPDLWASFMLASSANPSSRHFSHSSLTVTPAPTIHPQGHLLCPGLPYPHHSPLATTPPAEKGERRELGFQHGTRESWPRAAKPGGSVGCAGSPTAPENWLKRASSTLTHIDVW